ncbi:C-type lectin mosGCTL-7-like isoform X2 [Diabrotica undecimpunctata]|uniref:C-type lectin mosGCTL-7-like isoform X2 n=1 Tax=Diabrotica undecimpunctata TaxID=50387 RepID=UPI003B63AA5C
MYFKLILLLLICNVFKLSLQGGREFVSSVLQPSRGTPNWLSYAGKTYYKQIVFKGNYFKATQFCRQQGMQLLSINSHIENQRIGQFILDTGVLTGLYWTSGTKLVGEDQWVWLSTGQRISYTNWGAGEPSGKTPDKMVDENCLIFDYYKGNNAWNDMSCDSDQYFICESVSECDKVQHS